MNLHDNERPDIGEQNVERLLSSYKPELPDPAFIEQVTDRLCAAAEEIVRARQQPPTPERVLRVRRRLGWAFTVTAVAASVALVLHARNQWPNAEKPIAARDGSRPTVERSFSESGVVAGLTPRARPEVAVAARLAVGDSLQTKAGERRRVATPDGSVLYVNQNTTVKLDAPRHVALSHGEVFAEVTPQETAFVVQTPRRGVTALGTKFAVRAEETATGVVVTQGKVKVSGLDDPLVAGQQLTLSGGNIAPAPRASHLLDWTKDLMAAAESPLVPGSQYAGGALVARNSSGQESRLSLRKFHVDVHVEDGFARTTIDQTYFNHDYSQLEGTFYFPLPADASLSRLAMYVANGNEATLMEGGMAERDYARQVFETIRYTRRDPALLEWMDGSTFKMRVFPLEGRQEKRIILSYTQRLPSLYGRTTYRFPAGHSLEAVRDWSFHASVKNGVNVAWSSPSHPLLAATQKGNDLLLDSAEKQVKVDRDVVLELDEPSPVRLGPGFGVPQFSAAEHEGNRYLMVRYRPELPSQPVRQRRDWVFLFESSGDRDPLLARVQVDVIRTLLAHAEHDDTFAVLTCGVQARALSDKRLPATKENIDAALAALEKSHLIGALDVGKAMNEAEPLLKDAANLYLIHIGSGIPVLGERRDDVLAKRIPGNARYVGVAVGKRWSRSFMKAAADRTGGYFTQINPDEPIAWRAFELASILNTPRLLNVSVVDNAERVRFLSYASSISQGEEICAIARIPAGRAGGVSPLIPKSITITGTLDGETWHRDVPVANIAEHADYLPRTWAKLEIDRLLAEDATKHKNEIVALSKAMYVMTPFTSLLVLENEAMYEQYKVDRGRKDHWAMYACPAKIPVVHEAEKQLTVLKAVPGSQAPAEDILQTIVVRMPPPAFVWPEQRLAEANERFLRKHTDGESVASQLSPLRMAVRQLHADLAKQDQWILGLEEDKLAFGDRPNFFSNNMYSKSASRLVQTDYLLNAMNGYDIIREKDEFKIRVLAPNATGIAQL
ncbi:MAG TPA: VIT domain-containing protein, partial [Gemmataceae bacterium]|nr:VIT domain-containing protein [Gemmataceae bacterium]